MLWARVKGQAAQRREDEAFDEEIREHIALLEERYAAQGMSAQEAARRARRQFGNVTALKERQRAQRGILSPAEWWRDVRFGMRMLAKQPGIECGGGAGAGAGHRDEHRGIHVCEWTPAAAAAGRERDRKADRAVAEAARRRPGRRAICHSTIPTTRTIAITRDRWMGCWPSMAMAWTRSGIARGRGRFCRGSLCRGTSFRCWE